MNKESIDKQAFLEEMYYSAFKDELEKIAADPFRSAKLLKAVSGLSGKKKALIASPIVAGGSFIPIQDEYKPYENKSLDPDIKMRWNKISKIVDSHGAYAGTAHKRVVVPKDKLSEKSIKDLGFQKSYISVPESGQSRLVSYRHPDNNYHIHHHGDKWTVHEDRHSSSQMIAKKKRTIAGKAGAYTLGSSHTITEGVPGLYNYLKNTAGRVIRREAGSLAENVKKESKKAVGNIKRWKDESHLLVNRRMAKEG